MSADDDPAGVIIRLIDQVAALADDALSRKDLIEDDRENLAQARKDWPRFARLLVCKLAVLEGDDREAAIMCLGRAIGAAVVIGSTASLSNTGRKVAIAVRGSERAADMRRAGAEKQQPYDELLSSAIEQMDAAGERPEKEKLRKINLVLWWHEYPDIASTRTIARRRAGK